MHIIARLFAILVALLLAIGLMLLPGRRRTGLMRLWTTTLLVADALVAIGCIWQMVWPSTDFSGFSPLASLTLATLCLTALGLPTALALASKHIKWTWMRRAVCALCAVMAAYLSWVILWGTFGEPRTLKVRHHAIALPTLPEAFCNYRIAFVSDLHLATFGTDTTLISHMVDTLLALRPDMIAIAGDVVSFQSQEFEPFVQTLSRLHAPDGVYAVLGNHDYALYAPTLGDADARRADVDRLVDMQQRAGWVNLRNAHVLIGRGSDSLAIVGVENAGAPPFPDVSDMTKALGQLANGPHYTKVLLSHDPTHFRRAVLPETDIALMLSGHTHGGQLKLLGWQPIKARYTEYEGLYTFPDDRYLIVSPGVGETLLPFRYGVPPQIECVTLSKKTPCQSQPS